MEHKFSIGKFSPGKRAYLFRGRFAFTKKIGNFLLGKEKRVPFVTSPILGRPGRLIDRERHGTGHKDNKSVNGTQIFHWEVSTGKTGLRAFSIYKKIRKFSIGNFRLGKRVPFVTSPILGGGGGGGWPLNRPRKAWNW